MRIILNFLLVLLLSLGSTVQTASAATTLHNIRGFFPDLQFSLQGAGDKTVTQKALEGKVVLLYFGYTNCPDVCPTTMAEMAQVIKNLGQEGSDARIVFISVDPSRDTPDKLQTYVRLFSKDALGLTGSQAVIADVARRYRVAYQIERPTTENKNNYAVTHSRGIYIFDQQGRARLVASDAESVNVLTAAVKKIIDHPDKDVS
ncbi:MAG: SCO family protein [Candidimonas sp.]|nr:MAG: SCO family protein [Candidimonas sp.]TAM22699.1 MAG: SCO family protein [Candidimonas sp.]